MECRFPQNWLFLPQCSTIGHMTDTFGTRLQIARKRAGYKTQQQLADALGVTTRTIRNYEGNTTRPDVTVLDKLHRLLGDFDATGDPVEVALSNSPLNEWRRDTVKGFYKMHLTQQRQEEGA